MKNTKSNNRSINIPLSQRERKSSYIPPRYIAPPNKTFSGFTKWLCAVSRRFIFRKFRARQYQSIVDQRHKEIANRHNPSRHGK